MHNFNFFRSSAKSADYDKRVIMEDGIHTLACGHHKIPKPEDKVESGNSVYETIPSNLGKINISEFGT